jgi:tetratricopeptide (TPR) repeat protein
MSDIDPIVQQAFALMQRGQFRDAIDAFRKVISLSPQQLIAYELVADYARK